jgi:hypothetical protein
MVFANLFIESSLNPKVLRLLATATTDPCRLSSEYFILLGIYRVLYRTLEITVSRPEVDIGWFVFGPADFT